MKIKLFFSKLNHWKVLGLFLLRHCSETLLLLYAVVVVLIHTNLNYLKNDESIPCWIVVTCIIPFLFTGAYSMQFIRKRYLLWQILYYAIPLLLIPFLFVPTLKDFTENVEYFILVIVVLPLWILLLPFQTLNRTFSNRIVHMAWSVMVPLFFGGVAFLLLYLIRTSIILLFQIESHWLELIYKNSIFVINILIVPLLFLSMMEKKKEMNIPKFFENLLHWIISPALMIYTLLLYLYAGLILVRWELPQGNVAVMVFVFCLIAMLVKMLRQFTEKQPFVWYFNVFSWISLPLLLLFWTGCFRRISDYGLTESRYYLLFCGVLMTLYVFLFLFCNRRGYFLLIGTAFLFVLAMVSIRPFSAEQCSIRSQNHRVQQIAAELGILNDDGTLKLGEPSAVDSLYAKQHRKIYKSLDYLYSKDTLLLQTFGINTPADYSSTLSVPTKDYVTAWREREVVLREESVWQEREVVSKVESVFFRIDLDNTIQISIPEGYNNFCVLDDNYDASGKFYLKDDHLFFPNGSIQQDTLILNQLWKCGWKEGMPIDEEWLQNHRKTLLLFSREDFMLVFDNISFYQDSTFHVKYNWFDIHSVFLK